MKYQFYFYAESSSKLHCCYEDADLLAIITAARFILFPILF